MRDISEIFGNGTKTLLRKVFCPSVTDVYPVLRMPAAIPAMVTINASSNSGDGVSD